ncbi:MAG TPA: molybdenum cofactor guanylyltransferase [Kofleriaceae bacterium]|nr:molybdenum cofactor guanylyltransferase [Kofleriaceae bacterium]
MRDATAVILAGGRATRMGGALKPLLLVHGVTILERQLDVLQPRFAEVVISSNDADAFAGRGLRVIADAAPGLGPLAGLAAALAAARTELVFAIAGDMPWLAPAAIDLLFDRLGGADAAAPFLRAGVEPLHALYRTSCLPVIARRLADGALRTAGVLEDPALHVVRIGEDELRALDPALRFLANVNQPSDLS